MIFLFHRDMFVQSQAKDAVQLTKQARNSLQKFTSEAP